MNPKTPVGTLILAGLTLALLIVSAPDSLRDAFERGGFYLFSQEFVRDIPGRLRGPGWFRFIMQPLVAILLGIKAGKDALPGSISFRQSINHLTTNHRLLNLLLMGIILDSALQWIILGSSYPGASLVVGPVLILTPYTIARKVTIVFRRNRASVSQAQANQKTL